MSINLSDRTIERVNGLLIGWAVAFLAVTVIIIATLSGPESYAATVEPRPAVKTLGNKIVPCALEDGSGPNQSLPCYWDAGKRGNKIGRSFWIDKSGHFHYVKRFRS